MASAVTVRASHADRPANGSATPHDKARAMLGDASLAPGPTSGASSRASSIRSVPAVLPTRDERTLHAPVLAARTSAASLPARRASSVADIPLDQIGVAEAGPSTQRRSDDGAAEDDELARGHEWRGGHLRVTPVLDDLRTKLLLTRTQRRVFIGPHLLITPAADGEADDVISRRKELKRRWHSAVRRGKDVGGKGKERETLQWVGGSFEIGKDVREACAAERTRLAEADAMRTRERAQTEPAPSIDRISVDEPTRHASAPTHLETRKGEPTASAMLDLLKFHGTPSPERRSRPSVRQPTSDTASDTRLLASQPLQAEPESMRRSQGVRFDESPAVATGAQKPADPADVLARDDELTTAYDAERPRPKPGAIVRMDRMLVRTGWTIRSDIPLAYDEQARQRQPVRFGEWEEMAVVLRYRGRGNTNLELWSRSYRPYEPNRLTLTVDVPLRSARAGLCLFSPAHTTLSLVRAPRPGRKRVRGEDAEGGKKASKRDRLRHPGRQGTVVILMEARCRTIAKDWAFAIRRELGDELPDVLSIAVPVIDVKISLDGGDALAHRSPQDVSALCLEALKPIPGWAALIEAAVARGSTFSLAWQHGDQLEWIDHDESVDGTPRHWAATLGPAPQKLASAVQRPPALEFRLARHSPQTVVDERGQTVIEPPGIEGYVTRIHGASNNRDRVYLTVHDGHLFVVNATKAGVPDPPFDTGSADVMTSLVASLAMESASGVAGAPYSVDPQGKATKPGVISALIRRMRLTRAQHAVTLAAHTSDRDEATTPDAIEARFEAQELERIHDLIASARGYLRLRDLREIRPASADVASHDRDISLGSGGHKRGVSEQSGGTALSASSGKGDALARSFELVTHRGAVIRLETASEPIALEWVRRLTELREYWQRRATRDACEQTSAQPVDARRAAARMHAHGQRGELGASDPDQLGGASTELLSRVYSRCVVDGCRGLLKSGRLYERHGVGRGRFRERFLTLVRPATLLSYEIVDRTISGAAKPTAFHRRKRIDSLRDAYVLVGDLAVDRLEGPRGQPERDQLDANGHLVPRVYPDGLISADAADDCSLQLWWPQMSGTRLAHHGRTMILRARSRIERDEWVYAITVEQERLVRAERPREERLRAFDLA